MLEIATKSWDADTTFPESVRKQDPGQVAWASWGMIQRRGEHLITMHPMSQRYLARKKCRKHCTKSQASSGHIRSSSDKQQVLPSQLGWSVNSLSSWDRPTVLPQLLSSCQGHAPGIYKQN